MWISATRPAIEFSIGIMARSASPLDTNSKTSSKLAHGTLSSSGNICLHAIWELAPGSPWYAIFWVTIRMVSRPAPANPNRVAPKVTKTYVWLAFGAPIPGSILWGPAAEGRTSKSKMAVGM